MSKSDENRRDCPIVTYLTPSEAEAVAKLGADYTYQGKADAIRRGLALLIHTHHPELVELLRNDLRTLDKAQT